jgi:hypothetical protein
MSINSAMTELSVSAMLLSDDFTDSCVLKFWLLLLGGVVVFFAWLVLFSRCTKLWGSSTHFKNAFTTVTCPINMT